MKSGELNATSTGKDAVYWDRVSQNILSMGSGAALATMFQVRATTILAAVVILLGVNFLIQLVLCKRSH